MRRSTSTLVVAAVFAALATPPAGTAQEGGAVMAILPDLTHYEVFMAPELASTVLPFLNGVSRPPTWSGPPNRR